MNNIKDTNEKINLSSAEIQILQDRVVELEQTLHSIQSGKPDVLMLQSNKDKAEVFTLEGVDQPYRVLVESMSEGAITLSGEGKVIHCNKQFSEMVNVPVSNIIGTSFFSFIPKIQHEELSGLFSQCKTKSCKGMFTLQPVDDTIKTVFLSCKNFELGHVDGISIVATDITELNKMHLEMAASLKEKEAMLKEIYHRVKNNLQVISSLLSLQANSIEDPITRKIFIESSSRIKAMSLVHEMLYQSGNLSRIEIGKYVQNLAKNLEFIYHVDSNRIKLTIDADTILLSIENAVPFGLVVNELISNSFKHAFPSGKSGEIKVLIKNINDNVVLTVNDNGIGFPADFDFENTKTLGMRLVHSLTKQLGGEIVLDRSQGTTFSVTTRCHV